MAVNTPRLKKGDVHSSFTLAQMLLIFFRRQLRLGCNFALFESARATSAEPLAAYDCVDCNNNITTNCKHYFLGHTETPMKSGILARTFFICSWFSELKITAPWKSLSDGWTSFPRETLACLVCVIDTVQWQSGITSTDSGFFTCVAQCYRLVLQSARCRT